MIMFVFLCLHITAEKLMTNVTTFIGGNKRHGLKVHASFSSLCVLRNGERIIHMLNCDRKAPEFLYKNLEL
jgi:hypothetical protein